MPEEKNNVLWQLGKKLHEHYDGIANEPLPKRWVDLIARLNEQDRVRAQSERQRSSRAGG